MGVDDGAGIPHQSVRPEGYQRVESEQRRSRTQYGQIRPLPLRFDAQMFTCFLEGRLDPPAGHEALEDSGSFEVKVGTKKRLRVTLAGWITHQHPADRSWGHTVVIPDGRSGDILQLAGLTTIPLGQHDRCPYGFRIGKDGAEFGPAFAFNCRSSHLTLLAFGYWFEQTGVETQ